MKVAKKSPIRAPRAELSRATVTLPMEVYRKIDELRGSEARSAWLKRVVEKEGQRSARERFADTLRQQYTASVCRQTLLVNQEFPIHEA